MSHFYADIKGSRGAATRCGTPASGIGAHPRGWNVGVRVVGGVNDAGEDEFLVYATGGSNGADRESLVAIVRSNGEYEVDVEHFGPTCDGLYTDERG